MKKTFLLLLFSHFAFAISAQQKTIRISNPLPLQRHEEVIEISWKEISKAYPLLDTSNFKVIDAVTKKEYPYQLAYKGNKEVQHLLIQLTIPAKATIQLQLVKGKPKPVAVKTYCRYIKERKDDFAWENDRIAHRMYGKALEQTPAEMAYGIDVWVKRTNRLVLNERYQRADYHTDHGDGLDYYHVGLSLGAGAIAPYMHDTIWFPKNYRASKVFDNGPLRSTFQLIYDEWNVAGKKVRMTKTVSIDAGSQMTKQEIRFETLTNDSLPVVTGIIKRKEQGEMLLNEKDGILAYWEPQHGNDGTTGVACISTTPIISMLVNKDHLLAQTYAQTNHSFIYYSGAAWSKAGQITSSKEWFQYLVNFQNNIKNPLIISIK